MKKIKENLFCFEIIIIFICFLLSAISQIFVYTTDATQYIKSGVLIKFYQWILTENSLTVLKSIDGLAAVVGGISFFVKKWADEDTENIAVILILVVALVSAHIFSAIKMHLISFSLTIGVLGLLVLMLILIFNDSLKKSKRRAFKKSQPKIKN